jgi:hypothetical protein
MGVGHRSAFASIMRVGAAGNFESGVQTLYYGLGIVSMLGGAVAAYVKSL